MNDLAFRAMAQEKAPIETAPRLVEILASLSLAIDLGLGQPMEHVLRSSLIARGLAQAVGLDAATRESIVEATLLAWVGCTADSRELGAVFGDDIAIRRDIYYGRDRADPRFAPAVIGHVGRGIARPERALRVVSFIARGESPMHELITSHCLSAGLFAERLGLGVRPREILPQLFERWDGRGLPQHRRAEDIAIEMRVMHVADFVEVQHRIAGVAHACAALRARSGRKFDPRLVDAFCAEAPAILGSLDDDVWSTVVATASRTTPLTWDENDAALLAIGDFADLKSTHRAGHSPGVSALAAAAGSLMGLATADVDDLRRAALLHDLGRMGVSNTIWDRAARLRASEWERVRLYPYLTERTTSRAPTMQRFARLASRQHERLDGSGYPHGLRGSALEPAARVLAAADSYQAMIEPRAHRPALSASHAGELLLAEARAGRLDPSAVEAVLGAAGRRSTRRRVSVSGLTSREGEVLRSIASGATTRDVARTLGITEKTLRNHLDHIYAKIGVHNRTGATLFAIANGLTSQLTERSTDPGDEAPAS